MSEPTPTPPNTYRRRCRRCGQEVIETATAFGRVARFDPHPSPAGCFRFGPDGVATAIAPDEAKAGEPLYQSHTQSCAAPARGHDASGEG